MKSRTIKLNTISDVKEFVNIVAKYDFDVDFSSGRYSIDAKSIMGIFSLDIAKPLKLDAHTDEDSEFFNEISKFVTD